MARTVPLKSQRNAAFLPIAVLFAINVLNFYDRNVAGALVEPMRREFHLNDTQIGFIGSAFIWLYAIIGVPIGRIADSASRKKLLAWGIVIWTALTASTAFASSYALLVFTRLGVGVGEAACAPTATSWLGDICPPAKRSRALALFMLAVPIGGALSFFFSGPVAQAYGWRAAMVLAAAPALLLVPVLLTLQEPERGASEIVRKPLERKPMWDVLRIPTLWWIIASGALLNFNLYAIGTFLPAFLSRVHHLSLASSGVATGVVYAVGGIGGALLAGYLGDFITLRRKDGRLLIAAVAALLSVPFASVGILRPVGALFAALAFIALAYAALTMYFGLVYSAIQDLVAPNQRGTAMAIYFMAMYLCGASFGPLLTGHLSDLFARRAAALMGSGTVTEAARAVGLQQAMLIIPVFSVLLAFVLYMASRTVSADMSRQESTSIELNLAATNPG